MKCKELTGMKCHKRPSQRSDWLQPGEIPVRIYGCADYFPVPQDGLPAEPAHWPKPYLVAASVLRFADDNQSETKRLGGMILTADGLKRFISNRRL